MLVMGTLWSWDFWTSCRARPVPGDGEAGRTEGRRSVAESSGLDEALSAIGGSASDIFDLAEGVWISTRLLQTRKMSRDCYGDVCPRPISSEAKRTARLREL